MPKASQTPERVIRDKAFAKRLADAVESHPQAPSGHGRQSWLRERLESKFHSPFSAEALRKWFAGEARPKPKTMAQIAQILEVDEAWLSLGLKPGGTPDEKKKRNAVADGAVNYVAGLIQLSGGTIAFPETGEYDIDVYAIVKGRQLAIEVKLAEALEAGAFRASVNPKQEDHVLLVVVPGKGMSYDVLRATPEVIKAGRRRGGYIDLDVTREGSAYQVGKAAFEPVKTIEKLAS